MRRMSLYVAIALFISLGFGTNIGAVDFGPAKSYPVGTSPSSVVTGDFNRDGKLDLAVANHDSNNVSILLGNGDGTFQSAINFDAGLTQPSAIALGDFNGDGKLDLAVSSSSSVALLLGNGNGTFGAATPVSTVGGALFAADVNLDAKLDLVVSSTLLLGKGDGTFQAPQGLGFSPALAADFNKDGRPDFAVRGGPSVPGGPSKILIELGTGDGTFQESAIQAPANTTFDGFLFFGDFNGDGNIDLAVEQRRLATPGCTEFCINIPEIAFYPGLGNGQFFIPNSHVLFGSGGVVGDFNGDKKADLLFPSGVIPGFCPCPNGVLLLGPVANPVRLSSVLPRNLVSGVAADFDGNELPDLAFADNTNNTVVIVLNTSPTSGADLAITGTIALPEPVAVGQNLTYTLNFLNEGPEDATAVTLTDTLPNGVSLVSAVSGQGSCTQSQGIVTCSIPSLLSGLAADATIVVTPRASGTITNSVKISAAQVDLVPANNDASQLTTVLPVFSLTVTKAGTGTGSLWSTPAGVDCGNTCSQGFVGGTTVLLTATPSANSVFVSWSGACSGTDPNVCSVTLNSDQSVIATFQPTPDFSVTPAATVLSLQRGGQASEQLTFPAQGGFSGTIALSCAVAGTAPMPTCSISPNSISAGSSATLTIDARALTAGLRQSSRFDLPGGLFAAWLPLGVLGCMLTTCFDKKRRRLWVLCLMILLVAILPTACGGGSNTPPPRVAQNYTVTVAATSGAIQHSTAISVTVQ